MATYIRQKELLSILSVRKSATIAALANALEVSERTVRRDIDALSAVFPIYTSRGRYGCVHVLEDRSLDHLYFSSDETALMQEMLQTLEVLGTYTPSPSQLTALKTMVAKYALPIAKEQKTENEKGT